MKHAASLPAVPALTQAQLGVTATALLPRLRAFVRRRIGDLSDVDDIVQEALYELVAAQLTEPIGNVMAWLLRVARNRIIDRYRGRARERAFRAGAASDDEPARLFDELLADLPAPATEDPEAAYARDFLLEELAAALNELPAAQREVFIAHELDGQSFRQLADAAGESINTLLGRKHAAVLHLRRRLAQVRETFDI
jgi:RNA polymerase sigma factor (sigma-70 family)